MIFLLLYQVRNYIFHDLMLFMFFTAKRSSFLKSKRLVEIVLCIRLLLKINFLNSLIFCSAGYGLSPRMRYFNAIFFIQFFDFILLKF